MLKTLFKSIFKPSSSKSNNDSSSQSNVHAITNISQLQDFIPESIHDNEATITSSRQLKLLCLHGWRTSAQIMSNQTAALRFHLNIEANTRMTYINGPYLNEGPPDAGIDLFYPNYEYYEWFYRRDNDNSTLLKSLALIIEYINENGPFDGIVGFSQGASMATRVLFIQNHQSYHNNDCDDLHNDGFIYKSCGIIKYPFKFGVLIGGVTPLDLHESMNSPEFRRITLSSLHIMGLADPYLPESKKLMSYYNDDERMVLEHEEGHNIPSIRTGLYDAIKSWMYSKL